MKNKMFLISIVVLAAIFLSACGPAVLPMVTSPLPLVSSPSQPSQLAQSTSQAPLRLLTVNGTGQVSLKPDIAYIYVGIHTEKPTAAESVSLNNANTQKLIDALKAAGVDANDIQTTNFSIYQNNQYGPDGKQTSSNYAVDNTVYLTVRKLEKLGDLLDAAVKAGANNINSIQFDLADKSKALSQARAEAVKTAKSQADELATAAGVNLGDIQTIQYTDAVPTPMFSGKGMGGGAASADIAVPINPGQMQISVNVTISYEIK